MISADNHAIQANETKSSETMLNSDEIPKKIMKRIRPEKIAEVGEWKAEKQSEEADVEDNAEVSTDGLEST